MGLNFTQTSNEPYVRHHYQLVYQNGRKVVVDNYHDVHVLWNEQVSHVEVLDLLKGFK